MGGLFPDVAADLKNMGKASLFFAVMFVFFNVLAVFSILNMLIGIVVENIKVVSAIEEERENFGQIKGKLQKIMGRLDADGNGLISREEVGALLMNSQCTQALSSIGVDVVAL